MSERIKELHLVYMESSGATLLIEISQREKQGLN